MPRDQVEEFQELARDFVAPHGTDPVLETLIAAREWLTDPAHWCQGCLARSGAESVMNCVWSYETPYTSSCSVGSVFAIGASGDVKVTALALLKQALPKPFVLVHAFNDAPTTSHADVLALFDRAISSRRSEV